MLFPFNRFSTQRESQKLFHVDLPGRQVFAQIWLVQVGRVKLYLLDTNIPQNSPQDQDITDQLYGGDRELADQTRNSPWHRRLPCLESSRAESIGLSFK